MKYILLLFFFFTGCTATKNSNPSQIDSSQAVIVPSEFIDGERFFIKLATVTSDTLLGFGDTGGGFTAVYPNILEKLNLTNKIKHQGDSTKFQYILFEDLINDKRIPPPALSPSSEIKQPFFAIPPDDVMKGEISYLLELFPHDVFLGQFFFADKTWTFDYKNQRILTGTLIQKDEVKKENVQAVGFKKNEAGVKMYAHPSMQMEVDGELIDVLFDTGATFFLSKNGKEKLGLNKNTMAGSFIAKSVFDKWKQKHPQWKVIEAADNRADMIEVPQVKLGDVVTGPVLFSVRPDEVWSNSMIHSMDKVVKGAIGGSAFRNLVITIDYNNELIKFSR
jgi:hypothetical protein